MSQKMQIYCQENLIKIKHLLLKLSNTQYTHASSTLLGASIGQHVRHILEFYQSVFKGVEAKQINYDNRERNVLIETKTNFAIELIEDICNKLERDTVEQNLILQANFCAEKDEPISIKTTYIRELAYCLEHSIHHQALIKVGLLDINCLDYVDDAFGLAPASLRHQKTCTH